MLIPGIATGREYPWGASRKSRAGRGRLRLTVTPAEPLRVALGALRRRRDFLEEMSTWSLTYPARVPKPQSPPTAHPSPASAGAPGARPGMTIRASFVAGSDTPEHQPAAAGIARRCSYAGAKRSLCAGCCRLAIVGGTGVAKAASCCKIGRTRPANSRMFLSASACGMPPNENSVTR
jgi:hypothetical protein